MRCSCYNCGTYMVHAESTHLGCVCPECKSRCKACLGTNTVMSREALSCGITSGANVCAAMRLAVRPEFADRDIVTIAPDTGERYLSTALFPKD